MDPMIIVLFALGGFLMGLAGGFKLGVAAYDEKLRSEGKILSMDEMRAKVAAMVAEERARRA